MGSAALQIGVNVGIGVITTSSASDTSWCLDQGAAAGFDCAEPYLWPKVQEQLAGGADLWWDQSGRNELGTWLPLLREGGRMLITLGIGDTVRLPVAALYTRNISLGGFAISNATEDSLARAAAVVNDMLAQGRLQPRRIQTLDVSKAARAHHLLEFGQARGKLVLTV